MSLNVNIFFLILSVIFAVITGYEKTDIASARIESCRGCSLNRLPEVKRFIFEDAPNYERLEVKFITGADPELILLNDVDNELERLPLGHLSRSECNELIQNKGFTKKFRIEVPWFYEPPEIDTNLYELLKIYTESFKVGEKK